MKKSLTLLCLCLATLTTFAADKKIVFIAGAPSHGPGAHEHRAGCLLLKACLDKMPTARPLIQSPRGAEVFGKQTDRIISVVYSNGWPDDASVLNDAAAIVVYSDGGPNHPLLQGDRLKTIEALTDKGVGLAAIHYAVEPTKEKGQTEFLKWIGGAFEVDWSVNPHWTADFKKLPNHPITCGVKPFAIEDEWYFNMRFRDAMKGVTPILTAIPTPGTTNRNDGPHEGNPTIRKIVAKGEPVHVAWAAERGNGGRGFGFCGAHVHDNWANDDFRKVVLNAILWIAKVEVPKHGVQSHVTDAELKANLDPKKKK